MSLDITKHKNILIKILKDIYTDSTVGPLLGFKGGTATYLFYGLSRFSVDLDFDLLDETKEDYVFGRIERIISPYGKIKAKRKKRFTLFFELSYGEKDRNIKLEINRRSSGSSYEIKGYLGISMKLMVKEDIFANKLAAMLERISRANRDIYDVWFFLTNNWAVNEKIVKKRTNLSLKELYQKLIASLEEIGHRHLLAGMGELLDEKTKIWAKDNLKNDLIFLLKLRLENEKNL